MPTKRLIVSPSPIKKTSPSSSIFQENKFTVLGDPSKFPSLPSPYSLPTFGSFRPIGLSQTFSQAAKSPSPSNSSQISRLPLSPTLFKINIPVEK